MKIQEHLEQYEYLYREKQTTLKKKAMQILMDKGILAWRLKIQNAAECKYSRLYVIIVD